jgi:putative sigma-54 modulation protein
MEVEFTARQVKIPKALRTKAEENLERMARIVGKTAHASIIFSAQKLDQIVELTIQSRSQKIVAKGKAATQTMALKEAMERAENQALRHRDRRLENKRLPKEEKVLTALPVSRPKSRATQPKEEEAKSVRVAKKSRETIAVKSHPTKPPVSEPHVLTAAEAIATKPMTIEEAVKESEAGDRDLLIFHNPGGDLFVLHRRRDGEMELVEIP